MIVALRNTIGEGSYGIVYNATIDDKFWAVKRIQKKGNSNVYYQTILRELCSNNGIEFTEDGAHQIATPFKKCVHVNSSETFIIMEQASEIYPTMDFISIWFPLLKSLFHLHSLGNAHRDLKFPNILYDSKSHSSLLIDYGMSLMHQESSSSPNICTITTRAPEILMNKDHSVSSDLWSLGVLLKTCMDSQTLGDIGGKGSWNENTSLQRKRVQEKTIQLLREKVSSCSQMTCREWAHRLGLENTSLVTFSSFYALTHLLKWDPKERFSISDCREAFRIYPSQLTRIRPVRIPEEKPMPKIQYILKFEPISILPHSDTEFSDEILQQCTAESPRALDLARKLCAKATFEMESMDLHVLVSYISILCTVESPRTTLSTLIRMMYKENLSEVYKRVTGNFHPLLKSLQYSLF